MVWCTVFIVIGFGSRTVPLDAFKLIELPFFGPLISRIDYLVHSELPLGFAGAHWDSFPVGLGASGIGGAVVKPGLFFVAVGLPVVIYFCPGPISLRVMRLVLLLDCF